MDDEKIKLYHVQTFYGTEQKDFQSLIHAQQYWVHLKKQYKCVDPIEPFWVTQEEFVYIDIDD